MKETPTQERIGQLFFIVAGNHHNRSMLCRNRFTGLIDKELHPVEFQQQVIGKFDIGLIDFIDQQNCLLRRVEGFPEFAGADVVADIPHAPIAQLRVPQARYGIVLIQPLLGLARRLDVPTD